MNDKKVIESILDKISSLNGIANSLENEQLKQNLKDVLNTACKSINKVIQAPPTEPDDDDFSYSKERCIAP